jgi:hypothetical protein
MDEEQTNKQITENKMLNKTLNLSKVDICKADIIEVLIIQDY